MMRRTPYAHRPANGWQTEHVDVTHRLTACLEAPGRIRRMPASAAVTSISSGVGSGVVVAAPVKVKSSSTKFEPEPDRGRASVPPVGANSKRSMPVQLGANSVGANGFSVSFATCVWPLPSPKTMSLRFVRNAAVKLPLLKVKLGPDIAARWPWALNPNATTEPEVAPLLYPPTKSGGTAVWLFRAKKFAQCRPP